MSINGACGWNSICRGPISNDPRLMWAVTSQGCCSLVAASYFFPWFRHKMKPNELFWQRLYWSGCKTEHLSLVWHEERELGRGTKEEREVSAFLDSKMDFWHFNVSEIGMCLKSSYRFWTVCLPAPSTWKVVIKLMLHLKTEEMCHFWIIKSCLNIRRPALTFEKNVASRLRHMEQRRQFLTTGKKTGLKDKMFGWHQLHSRPWSAWTLAD